MKDLVVITDVPTPYREPVFEELAARLNLLVIYGGQISTRGWDWWRYLSGHESRFLAVARPTSPWGWGRAVLRLWRLLDQAEPRAVVVGGWNLPTSWVTLLYGRRRRVPVALWVESTSYEHTRPRPTAEALKRRLVRLATSVLVPGARSAEYARSLGARAIELAPNAVRNSEFASPNGGSSEAGPKVVLFVGRLAAEKGLGVLAEAAARLARIRSFNLVIVGDGPESGALESALADSGVSTRFTGPLATPSAVADALRAADVLVLPSISEPWGLVVNEAMAAEVPVVVSDVVGCGPDLVIPGLTGEVFPNGDAAALCSSLDAVLARGRTAEVRAACRRASERHSPARCADGFIRFFQGAAAGKGR